MTNEFERLENALIRAGRAVEPVSAPALASRVLEEIERERIRPARGGFILRPAWSLALAILVALAILLAFPETRDAIGQILSLRTIRIFQPTPTPTAEPTSPQSFVFPVTATPFGVLELATATPAPTATPQTVQCCETTLASARTKARFPILVPPDVSPSRVFFQDITSFGPGVQQLILVFGDPQSPRWVLYEATGILYQKMVSGRTVITETRALNQRALWLTDAPHLLVTLDASGQTRLNSERSVYKNTLAWEIGDTTFRLETDARLDDAVKFAASLR
jgi:hypothetical protein